MRFNELNVGLKLELKLYSADDNNDNAVFVSEFEWAENDRIIYIAAPIKKGTIYPVSINQRLELVFIKGENLYQFEGKVIGREVRHNISLLRVETTSEIQKIQRREFFRFDCSIPVGYRIAGKTKIDTAQRGFTKSYTRDLSGGGVCIRLKEKIETGELLDCELSLNDFNKVSFTGRVVRLTEYESKNEIYKYEIGVLFEAIEDRDRERIISYIFQEQRRLIKKG
ncbi:flagellar brake protein [Acetivibrio mesophilus]|uniref:Flagellar brake protein n=1 Tax=Acetivibrio mesophilus TaxID=2487273 RepID=A0A4Q0I762_9FIRM|nr:flagellar brake protein [Acetivibrio mesophilus]ODM25659.1 pilus assembly protein PilZ [Clostridium sp. Bc-iso-3]RXE60244.1 flagellar brake protein [Acetivibrio mesophilus]HHV29887.1 flagellar brake protein [Clostridium sp.]